MVWKGSDSFTEGNVLAELCESEVVLTGTAHFPGLWFKSGFPCGVLQQLIWAKWGGDDFWQGNV